MRSGLSWRVEADSALAAWCACPCSARDLAFMFHGWIAMGLVTRGDDLLRAGGQTAPFRLHTRVCSIVVGSPASRFAFAASLTGDRRTLEQAIALTSAHLARNRRLQCPVGSCPCLLHLRAARGAFRDLTQLARARRADWRMNDMCARASAA